MIFNDLFIGQRSPKDMALGSFHNSQHCYLPKNVGQFRILGMHLFQLQRTSMIVQLGSTTQKKKMEEICIESRLTY